MPKAISRAAALRKLARNAEKIEAHVMQKDDQRPEHGAPGVEQDPFTCNAISDALDWDVRRRYKDVLLPGYDEDGLWEQEDFASIRVLLLCFAAALAETGDL